MTLILSAMTDRLMSFSDCLLSRQGVHPDQLLSRPMSLGPEHVVVGSLTAVGLRQKTVQIDPQHHVLWAGREIVASHLIRALDEAILVDPGTTLATVIAESELSAAERASISLIYHRIDSEAGLLAREFHNCKDTIYLDQKITFAGTGDFHFIDDVYPEFPFPANDDSEQLYRAWLPRIAYAFALEAVGHETINFGYGGWFELSRALIGRLEKVPYLIKFWGWNGETLESLPCFSAWYVGHTLCVGRFEFNQGMETCDAQLTQIPDFLGREPLPSLDAIAEGFQLAAVQLHVIIEQRGLLYTSHRPGDWPHFVIDRVNGSLVAHFGPELRDEIEQMMRGNLAPIARPYTYPDI